MSGIQALAAAAAATHKISAPAVTSVAASAVQQITTMSVQGLQTALAQGQVVKSPIQSTVSSSPSPSSAAGVATATVSTATSSPIRIVQAPGTQTIRVASPGKKHFHILFSDSLEYRKENYFLPMLYFFIVGQTIRLAAPGSTILRGAVPGQAGKQIILQRPGSNQPGQIVTLVKTSQGMTVASVSLSLQTFWYYFRLKCCQVSSLVLLS